MKRSRTQHLEHIAAFLRRELEKVEAELAERRAHGLARLLIEELRRTPENAAILEEIARQQAGEPARPGQRLASALARLAKHESERKEGGQ